MKQLRFTYDGKEYILNIPVGASKQWKKAALSLLTLKTRPMTTLPALFAGAFLANHRFVKQDVINEIYSKLDKQAGTLSAS